MIPTVDRNARASAWRHRHVEVPRIRRDTFDGPSLSSEVAAHDAHTRAVVVDDLRDVGGADILIARRGHLERRGQIGPELKAVHPASGIASRHLLVHDAAPRRHPLAVAGGEYAGCGEGV